MWTQSQIYADICSLKLIQTQNYTQRIHSDVTKPYILCGGVLGFDLVSGFLIFDFHAFPDLVYLYIT